MVTVWLVLEASANCPEVALLCVRVFQNVLQRIDKMFGVDLDGKSIWCRLCLECQQGQLQRPWSDWVGDTYANIYPVACLQWP